MKTFSKMSPEPGVPVWLWRNGRWVIAAISLDKFNKKLWVWSLLTDELLSAKGNHIWQEVEPPLGVPPAGSYGDAE